MRQLVNNNQLYIYFVVIISKYRYDILAGGVGLMKLIRYLPGLVFFFFILIQDIK